MEDSRPNLDGTRPHLRSKLLLYDELFAPVSRVCSQRVMQILNTLPASLAGSTRGRCTGHSSTEYNACLNEHEEPHGDWSTHGNDPKVLPKSPALGFDVIYLVLLEVDFTPTSANPFVFTCGNNDAFAVFTPHAGCIVSVKATLK